MLLVALASLLVHQRSSWVKELPGGAKITLYAVADYSTGAVWRPDGTGLSSSIKLLNKVPMDVGGPDRSKGRFLVAIVRIVTGKTEPLPTLKASFGEWELTNGSMGYINEGFDPKKRGPFQAIYGGYVPSDQGLADLNIRCATEAWKTVGTYDMRTNKASGAQFAPHTEIARRQDADNLGKPLKGRYTTHMSVKAHPPAAIYAPSNDRRLIVLAANGQELEEGGSSAEPVPHPEMYYEFVVGADKPAIIELQTRPFHRFQFAGVHLKANAAASGDR